MLFPRLASSSYCFLQREEQTLNPAQLPGSGSVQSRAFHLPPTIKQLTENSLGVFIKP